MKTYYLPLLCLLCAGTMTAASAIAAETPPVNCVETPSYADKMGEKALNGLANIGTGILEMPKNTINTVNESNIVLGLVGGAVKGALHTAGRMTAGLADLLTFWLPTDPISEPSYVWEDFDTTTTYGKTFRVPKNSPLCNEPKANE